jgi:hypothetical protein
LAAILYENYDGTDNYFSQTESQQNVRIYRYYRDLVSFRHRGDPGLLLRCINPHESSLIADRASGAVVRFRLGGSQFPPVVYYKIYLRSSVTDIGAFAPRDYTTGKPTQHYLLLKHNSVCRDDHRQRVLREVTHEVDKSRWYHRFENNGWRPIANKHLQQSDFVVTSTALKRFPSFHYSAEVRKKQVDEKRNKRKERWMMHMYRAAATERGDDMSGKQIPIKEVVDEFQEQEDAMDAWLKNLNFDDYIADWSSLATSISTMELGPGAMIRK